MGLLLAVSALTLHVNAAPAAHPARQSGSTPTATPTATPVGAGVPLITPVLTLVPVAVGFNHPIGIDHYEPLRQVVLSVNYSSGLPNNFDRVNSQGTPVPFATVGGWTEEVKIATARDTLGGFAVGDLFTGNGQPGQIARLTNNGQTVLNPWVVLTPESGLLRGSLYVDRTGIFGGDLIAVTTAGGVWRISASQQATQLANLGVHLEGVITVPDEARYGPWRGKILVGAEEQHLLWAINPQGTPEATDLGIGPEDIDLIPANENFFGVDYGNSRLVGAPAAAFTNWVGDIVIAQEGNPAILWRVWWDGSAWQKQALAQVGQWEHVTFSSAGLPPIPPIPTNTPTPTRTPTSTPTNTPTPILACLTPTLVPYPWGCTIINTPVATATPPASSTGYFPQTFYVWPTSTPQPGTTPPNYFYNAGYNQADKMATYGPGYGLVILDFGLPYFQEAGDTELWGTKLINCRGCATHPFITSGEIMYDVSQFAQGFADRARTPGPDQDLSIVLAVGTNNDLVDLDPTVQPTIVAKYREHGQLWGNMVKTLDKNLAKFAPWVQNIEGANDIEFDFGDATTTLRWAQGYEEVTRGTCPNELPCVARHVYYDFGSCDGCYFPGSSNPPWPPRLGNGWGGTVGGGSDDLNRVVSAAWANAAAYPIPQVYNSNFAMQWQWVSMYSANFCVGLPDYGIPQGTYGDIYFVGATGESTQTFGGGAAWQKLWQALQGTTCTGARPMTFATTAGYCIPDPTCP